MQPVNIDLFLMKVFKEYLMWCFKTKRFSWTIIQAIHNEVEVIVGNCVKAHGFREVLTNKAVGIFI